MDYRTLAIEFFSNLNMLRKFRPPQHISEALRGEAFALQYIAVHDGPVLPGEISAEMNISSARIAVALNNLESKGLITRRIDASDRRRVLVELTPEGSIVAEERKQELLRSVTTMLLALNEKDASDLVRITGELARYASDQDSNA